MATHYLNGELLYRDNADGTRSWVLSVLNKAIGVIRQVIVTWEQRKKQKEYDEDYAEWHLEYHRDRLQRYIKTRDDFDKAKS